MHIRQERRDYFVNMQAHATCAHGSDNKVQRGRGRGKESENERQRAGGAGGRERRRREEEERGERGEEKQAGSTRTPVHPGL